MAEKLTYGELEQRVRELEGALLSAQGESRLRSLEVSALRKCSRSLLEYEEFVDAARHVFDQCKKLVGATAGYVALLNTEKDKNEVLFLDSGGLPCTVDSTLPMPIRGLRSEAYNSGRPVYNNEFASSHWVQYMPKGHVELKNVMFSPLVIEGQTVGLLGLANKDSDFNDDDARMAAGFGELAAIALRNGMSMQERKRGEEALKRERDKAQMYLDIAAVIMVAINTNGEVTLINKKGCEIIGCKEEEIVGKNWFVNFLPPRLRDKLKNVSLQLLAGEIEPAEYYENPILTKTGEERIIAWHNTLLRDEEGNIVGHLSSGDDITDRLRETQQKEELEAKLKQSQKMEAVGTLAGGIAHNFNNLLMAILGNVSLMLIDIDNMHPHYELLMEIKNQANNGAELARQLLGYARKGKYYVHVLNLNDIVTKACEAFGATRKEISIVQELSEDLFPVKLDRWQINQVLLNLFINAADAMPAGGDLILKTANVTDKHLKLKSYNPKPGKYVQLTVTDTGHGMGKGIVEKIFEPFFTTKPVGQGTGLGLASVYGIVKAHDGYIDVESVLDKGTTFTLYFPATDEKAEESVESSQKVTMGSGTILLVDDEDRFLLVGRRLLERLGYTVIEAKSGKDAVEIYRGKKTEIDLVILDIIMPYMGGGEVYDKMKKINPDVKVLLSSGYDIDKNAKELLKRGCNAFIQKPFDLQGLSKKVREALGKK